MEVDILGVDISGVDILGVDILRLTQNLHYCRFIRIALIIQVQNQERSMRLISNMRFLASCAY